MTLGDRIYNRVEYDGDCAIWAGALNNPNGYGVIGWRENGTHHLRYVHRLVYEAFHGSITAEQEIHHLCKRKTCINPEHLVAVTHNEHLKSYHRTKSEKRDICCPRCGENEWLHRYLRGRPNGWRCATCHARTELFRKQEEQ